MDLFAPSHIHIVGIGGAGMSSMAVVLLEMGHSVSGSDLSDNLFEQLEAAGANVSLGHNPKNVPNNTDYIAYSSAINATNPELVESTPPKLTRTELLVEICSLKETIAITGAHGKTTTTAMLASALGQSKVSYIFGGQWADSSLGGHWENDGKWLVVEADESDGTFLKLSPALTILTSMDADHLEYYGGAANLEQAYWKFATSNRTILSMDDPKIATHLKEQLNNKDNKEIISVGSVEGADVLIKNRKVKATSSTADIVANGKSKTLKVPMLGRHNISNAALAYVAGTVLGEKPKILAKGLENFKSLKRRLEIVGEKEAITFIDDYAHTPVEISETLATLKASERRVVCAFQPHRYSRVQTLWETYAEAFKDCDILTISEIYSAGEQPRSGISGKLIVDAVLNTQPYKRVAWIPNKKDLLSYITPRLKAGDIFITLNAGDLNQIGREIYQNYQA